MKDYDQIKVSANTLCDMTGLTDRRHRQLADEGFLPKPKGAQYPLIESLCGIIKFLRTRTSPALERLNEAKLEEQLRKNRIADKLERAAYVPTERVSEILGQGIKTLELIPAKMASEFGWSAAQEKRLQKLLDEARGEWSRQMALTSQKDAANE